MLTGQAVSITSNQPGTTTDVVEKQMELLPLGPVLFFDTGGLDDSSKLASERVKKARKVLDGVDVGVIVVEPGAWGEYEKKLLEVFENREVARLLVVTKIDRLSPGSEFRKKLEATGEEVVFLSSHDPARREQYLNAFKRALIGICPADFLNPPTLVGDLLEPGRIGVLVVPVDLQAPKDRLILPQVQTIRNALDNDLASLVVKDSGYAQILKQLKRPPGLTVCDSQVVEKIARLTPEPVPLTTFSILFARRKGNLEQLARSAAALQRLQPGDRLLIAEACTHHPIEGDIGRDKIPRWLNSYVGGELQYEVYAGRDFPEELQKYRLIVHCGGCMINRRRMLYRTQQAREAALPITNYGLCIAETQGLTERVLAPFPEALETYRSAK